jgi:ABC-2 type transport system ATP-binding protein
MYFFMQENHKTKRYLLGGYAMSEIIIENLSKTIKNNKILDNVNLTFESGHVYGLVGRNGSGKTMLLRAICGLIFPDSGKVIIDGKQLHKDISFPESCGIIIENTDLLPNFSAFDNLKMLSEIKNTANDNMIKSAIKSVGLDPDSKKKVKTFSLGMKQRLSIAQALFEDPDILLLDEPTNALDEDGVNDVRRILLEQKKKNKLIIIASHNKEDISLLSDTVISVSNGRFQRK